MRAALVALLLAACTDPKSPPCTEVGCGSAALCNRQGECTCPQPDGGTVACEREPIDAGVP